MPQTYFPTNPRTIALFAILAVLISAAAITADMVSPRDRTLPPVPSTASATATATQK